MNSRGWPHEDGIDHQRPSIHSVISIKPGSTLSENLGNSEGLKIVHTASHWAEWQRKFDPYRIRFGSSCQRAARVCALVITALNHYVYFIDYHIFASICVNECGLKGWWDGELMNWRWIKRWIMRDCERVAPIENRVETQRKWFYFSQILYSEW